MKRVFTSQGLIEIHDSVRDQGNAINASCIALGTISIIWKRSVEKLFDFKKDKDNRERKKLHCKKFRYLCRSPSVTIVKSRGYDRLHRTRTNMCRTSMRIRLGNTKKKRNGRIILK